MFASLFELLADIGLGHPASRAVAFGAAGFGAQYLLKPSVSYVQMPAGKNGQSRAVAKDFKATSSSPSATWFPWYMWPVVFAIIGGLFI